MAERKLKTEKSTSLSQKKLDFLLEVEYLMKKMGHSQVSLEKGYEELASLMRKNLS